MIEIKNLYKSFDDKEVLKGINATFENGKTNLIIGQSGSGKTVFMKCRIFNICSNFTDNCIAICRNFLMNAAAKII